MPAECWVWKGCAWNCLWVPVLLNGSRAALNLAHSAASRHQTLPSVSLKAKSCCKLHMAPRKTLKRGHSIQEAQGQSHRANLKANTQHVIHSQVTDSAHPAQGLSSLMLWNNKSGFAENSSQLSRTSSHKEASAGQCRLARRLLLDKCEDNLRRASS